MGKRCLCETHPCGSAEIQKDDIQKYRRLGAEVRYGLTDESTGVSLDGWWVNVCWVKHMQVSKLLGPTPSLWESIDRAVRPLDEYDRKNYITKLKSE